MSVIYRSAPIAFPALRSTIICASIHAFRIEHLYMGSFHNMYKTRQRTGLPTAGDTTVFWGYILVLISFLVFTIMMFNVIGSKFLNPTGNKLLDFLASDWYYSMLIPLTLPVTIVALFINWLSMKFFRHN